MLPLQFLKFFHRIQAKRSTRSNKKIRRSRLLLLPPTTNTFPLFPFIRTSRKGLSIEHIFSVVSCVVLTILPLRSSIHTFCVCWSEQAVCLFVEATKISHLTNSRLNARYQPTNHHDDNASVFLFCSSASTSGSNVFCRASIWLLQPSSYLVQ